MKKRVFIVDDDSSVCKALTSLLSDEGYLIRTFSNLSSFRQGVAGNAIGVLLLDIALPDEDGLTALPRLRFEFPDLGIIMITGEATIERAVSATKQGAYDFQEKPVDPPRLLLSVRNLFELMALKTDVQSDREDAAERYRIVGQSAAIAELVDKIMTVASADSTVLITGENGTGKELVAYHLWANSLRKQQPFIKLNCASLPHELAESELFGFRKGAFTGADRNRDGKFKAADGGTVFLDEIAELSPSIQAKFLRILESGELEPLGSDASESVDVRVITATNRQLDQLVAEGKFRADLYYRLNIVPLNVPSLRERREDIPLLVAHFCSLLNSRTGLGRRSFSADAVGYLSGMSWPGNVRELRNIVERCYIMSRGEVIDADDVHRLIGLPDGINTSPDQLGNKLAVAIENFERSYLRAELEKFDGNISELARSLGVDRGNLSKKLRALGIV